MGSESDLAPDDGDGQTFPSTRWSRVLAHGTESRLTDWDALARAYERPIREWLRCRLRDEEAAADLTQEFFVWMIESRFTARADPARGRFRSFLKTALRHFVVDRQRAESAEKRGGGCVPTSVDDEALAARGGSPDAALDATWRASLIERALAALEADLRASGKEVYFRVFRDYFVVMDGNVDHAGVAERYGLRTTDVSNYLRVAKNRFRALLHCEILATVGGPEDLGAELSWAFALEGGRKS